MRRHFVKMHGAGNDFVIFDTGAGSFRPDPALVRRLADRHRGIGFDQLLVLGPPERRASTLAYRVYNADGEPAAQCGNGARCIARLALDSDSVSETIALDSPSGPVAARVDADGQIAVRMAVPDFDPEALPLAAARAEEYALEVDGGTVRFGAVSMGNPHAVLWVDDVAAAPVASLGAAMQRSARFPEGVNVGFAERLSPARLRLRVFERGAGETLACGTGACAAVAVGRARGWLDSRVEVHVPGGRLVVSWAGMGEPVWLAGPAERVFEGYIEL